MLSSQMNKAAFVDLAVDLHVPRVGHAPMLNEPKAVAAIDRLLKRVLQAARGA